MATWLHPALGVWLDGPWEARSGAGGHRGVSRGLTRHRLADGPWEAWLGAGSHQEVSQGLTRRRLADGPWEAWLGAGGHRGVSRGLTRHRLANGPWEAWLGAGGLRGASRGPIRCSLASSGGLCLHLGPSPHCLPQPPPPLLCLPGEASGPWALSTQTGHKAGTPAGRALWPGPRVLTGLPGEPMASRSSTGRWASRVSLWGSGAQVILGVRTAQIPGRWPQAGSLARFPHREPPVSTKRAEPLVLGRGLRSEIIRVTVDGVPLRDAHVLAAPSALVTTQVGVGWPTSSGGDLGGAEGRPPSAWSQPCRR